MLGLIGTLLSNQSLTERQRSLMGIIQSSGQNLFRLVSDLSDLLSSRSGDLQLDFEEVDLKEARAETIRKLLQVYFHAGVLAQSVFTLFVCSLQCVFYSA